MSETITLMGLFQTSTATADAIDELHRLNVPEPDVVVMTGIPFPEQALGRHHEWIRLPYIVLAGAFAGLLFGLFLSTVTPALYPLTVGGRSVVTGPPAAVITYVFTMMATIVSTFLGVLWEMGFPSFEPKYYSDRVTSGNLAVLVTCQEEQAAEIKEALVAHGGQQIHRPERMPL
ncbi:MAG: quinol:electron acceptor oxidoreductase subunit ActD [Candidatus Promineifilaceae bacterium]|nr:quinol:electron acceptor oxidoreductase subunit ActD [Candidatus Promineifilaceae bacterium]